jgi:DNA-binding NarL/FixJ family response regulator
VTVALRHGHGDGVHLAQHRTPQRRELHRHPRLRGIELGVVKTRLAHTVVAAAQPIDEPGHVHTLSLADSRGTVAAMGIRVVMAEDALIVREGILRLLEHTDDVEVVAVCNDYDELLAAVDLHLPDVILTDIRMPPTGTDEGIRAALVLRQRHPELGVVVLSQYIEPQWAIDLLDGGTARNAYLLKERVGDPGQLVSAIRQVAAGGSVVDPKVVDALIAGRSRGADSPLQSLTPREREVLAEIAQGKNNAAIAHTLVLSARAVEKHINSMFSKLGLTDDTDVHRRVAAVLLYLADRGQGGG